MSEVPSASATTPSAGARIPGVSRRNLLAVGAVGAGAAALAACSQAKSPAPVASGPAAGGGTSSTPAGGGASASAGGSSSGGSSSAAVLAKLSDITVGSAISATDTDGSKIIIARPTDSTVAAFSAICTHQGCVVAPAGGQLDCPCHGSVFNASTGAVINGPASRSLPSVSVKISGENIVAG